MSKQIFALVLFVAMGSLAALGQTPYGVNPPDGTYWSMTFDDEFTQDSSINTNYWNGGAGNTDWCDNGGGAYMFREDPSTECDQHYDGLTLDGYDPLQMTSPGYPSAAIQTGGTSASSANFIQEYGYWEASFEVPDMSDSGYSAHSDFWMHPIPENVDGTVWVPEIDIGERPTWLGRDSSQCNNPGTNDNTQMSWSVAEGGLGPGVGGYFGDSAGDDMSQNFHTYGMWWNNDGSGPYGSIQFYLDGSALLSSPFVLSSNDTNMANGIYMFLSLDQDCPNDSDVNPGDPFLVQYVRVWQLNSD